MTNQEIIDAVNRWQRAGIVHELTCPTTGCGADLVPEEHHQVVNLYCKYCDYVQTWIPEVVLNWKDWRDK